jgi:hypothetical protein
MVASKRLVDLDYQCKCSSYHIKPSIRLLYAFKGVQKSKPSAYMTEQVTNHFVYDVQQWTPQAVSNWKRADRGLMAQGYGC